MENMSSEIDALEKPTGDEIYIYIYKQRLLKQTEATRAPKGPGEGRRCANKPAVEMKCWQTRSGTPGS